MGMDKGPHVVPAKAEPVPGGLEQSDGVAMAHHHPLGRPVDPEV